MTTKTKPKPKRGRGRPPVREEERRIQMSVSLRQGDVVLLRKIARSQGTPLSHLFGALVTEFLSRRGS